MVVLWPTSRAGYSKPHSCNVRLLSNPSRVYGIFLWQQTRYILVEWQLWVTPHITEVTVSYTVPIGLGIVIFAVLFTLILSLDAIHHQNNVLLVAICLCNSCTLVFSIMRFMSMRGITNTLYSNRYKKPTLVDTSRNIWPHIQPAEIILSVIVGVSSLSLWICAYFLHKEFSWTIYKSVHGNPEARKRYRAYEVLYLPNPFSHLAYRMWT